MINFVTIFFKLLKFVQKSAVMGICEVEFAISQSNLKGDVTNVS